MLTFSFHFADVRCVARVSKRIEGHYRKGISSPDFEVLDLKICGSTGHNIDIPAAISHFHDNLRRGYNYFFNLLVTVCSLFLVPDFERLRKAPIKTGTPG